MIAAWTLFALITGGAFSLGAAAGERVAMVAGRSRRWIWVGAMIATAFWPGIVVWISQAAHTVASRRALPLMRGAHQLPGLVVPMPIIIAAPAMERVLLATWGVFSTGLLLRLVLSARVLRQWRWTWPRTDVDGVSVLVARDAGPAIVGLHMMDVVLPTWALALDAPRRA
ncbi:MAG: hypothetical protein M3154_00390, partial [Candidatus Eremiobacteraeota bacterium]|nr:hypothetical protein [Candidatus Eremiobacteraeota bacterium]